MQISKYTYADSQYPDALREINNPPKSIFCSAPLRDLPLVAIVGSRRPTTYGRQVTYQLASELAHAGVGIVSGMAAGIDAIAHRAALDSGGYTVAVLGSGLNQVYPAQNRELAQKIINAGGVLLSEYEPGTEPRPYHFPARNRIISGLSKGVVVSEAANESGSLITAQHALEQNRLVMAVPGNITSLRSAGPNNLIRSGATPVTSSSDVLAALNLTENRRGRAVPANHAEATILNLMQQGITSSKDLIERSRLDAAGFAQVITLMEIRGKVRNLGAGVWIPR